MSTAKERWIAHAAFACIAAAAGLVILGLPAFRAILGYMLMAVPFYLFLERFDLSESEQLLFSLIAALVIFPTLAWGLGFVMPFRMAVVVVFVVMIGTTLFLNRLSKKSD